MVPRASRGTARGRGCICMSEANDGLALWAVLFIIFAGIFGLLSLVTCCVVRCFRPEGKLGPEWFPSKDGEARLVKGVMRSDRPEGETSAQKAVWLRSASA